MMRLTVGTVGRASARIGLLALLGTAVVAWQPWALGTSLEADQPKVLAAWAVGPFESRMAFDRAVDSKFANGLVGREITFREAGRTFDSLDDQGRLNVAAARLEDDGKTLVLTTDPHPRAGSYRLTLPGDTPVGYDLSGVEAAWTADGGEPKSWTGSWPSFDTAEVGQSSGSVSDLARSLALLRRPGRLTLAGLVSLPKGPVRLTVQAADVADATFGGEEPQKSDDKSGAALFVVESNGEPTLLTFSVPTGADPKIQVLIAEGSKSPVVLNRAATVLPWVPQPAAPTPPQAIPDLKGGDPARGAEVFANTESKCANCHKARGKGGDVGPNLDRLVGRDRADVYRDIAEPSAQIHPDYVPYTLALKDGRVLVGTVRADGADRLRVIDTEAKSTTVPRAELEEFRPSATSIMPVGLAGVIGEARMRDLVAFLTTKPAD